MNWIIAVYLRRKNLYSMDNCACAQWIIAVYLRRKNLCSIDNCACGEGVLIGVVCKCVVIAMKKGLSALKLRKEKGKKEK